MTHYSRKIQSPLGKLTLVATDHHLVAVLWENDCESRVKLPPTTPAKDHPILLKTQSQLQEYFEGQRQHFQLPLEMNGTPFQIKVWRGLQKIPFAKTTSYKQLANSIGHSKAYRAVGTANRCNPHSIIVPCHRVIGSNGTLTGFAGGLKAKAYLLDLEKNHSLNNRKSSSI